jgi:hypothetical protein
VHKSGAESAHDSAEQAELEQGPRRSYARRAIEGPRGLDAPAYASGYIEGQAQRAKRSHRVINSPKASKDAR